MPLSQVSSIVVKDGTTLALSVWDKQMIRSIEKAITESDIGLTPTVNGTAIHLNIPPLTEERRVDLIKVVGKYGESARVSVRNIRRDANQALKDALKEGLLTKDEIRKGEEKINALTHQHIKEVDQLLTQKEKEIMSV